MKKIANCTFSRKVIREKRRSVLFFSSKSCHHCETLRPILKKIEEEAEGVEFFEMDIIENPNLVQQYSAMYLPTVIIFNDGKVESMIQGLKKEKKYYNKIGVAY